MQLNGQPCKLRRKAKRKVTCKPSHPYYRWESASSAKSTITQHRQPGLAIARAAQLHGFVRSVSYGPEGIIRHGQWRRV